MRGMKFRHWLFCVVMIIFGIVGIFWQPQFSFTYQTVPDGNPNIGGWIAYFIVQPK